MLEGELRAPLTATTRGLANFRSRALTQYADSTILLDVGFVDSTHCDLCLFVGDVNVDFDCNNSLKSLLVDFVDELDQSVCDLSYKDTVQYTYRITNSFHPSSFWFYVTHGIVCVRAVNIVTFLLRSLPVCRSRSP